MSSEQNGGTRLTYRELAKSQLRDVENERPPETCTPDEFAEWLDRFRAAQATARFAKDEPIEAPRVPGLLRSEPDRSKVYFNENTPPAGDAALRSRFERLVARVIAVLERKVAERQAKELANTPDPVAEKLSPLRRDRNRGLEL